MEQSQPQPPPDYEFDGVRLSRGSLRLGFRSLVPREASVDALSDEVVDWTIGASLLLNLDDPFAQDELPLVVTITERFTPAGRMKLRVRTRPEDREKVLGKAFEVVFRVVNNDVPVAPIVPSHPIRFVCALMSEGTEQEMQEEFLSCKRLVVPMFIPGSRPMRFLIGEAGANLGIGGKVWDGSLAMLEFLFATDDRWDALGLPSRNEKLRILDLGSGTGILGHGLALLMPDATVVNTDLPEVLPLLQMNAQGIKNLRTAAYAWGGPLPLELAGLEPFDIIFMCDVVYDQDCYEPLLKSLQRIRTKHVLMSHRHRNRSEVEFFSKIALEIGTLECIKYPIIKEDDPFHAILRLAKPTETVFDAVFRATMNDVAVFRITVK